MHVLNPLDATLILHLVVCLSIRVQTKSLGPSERRQRTGWWLWRTSPDHQHVMEIHEVQQANCVLMSCAWTAKRVGRIHIGRKLMHNCTLINFVNQPICTPTHSLCTPCFVAMSTILYQQEGLQGQQICLNFTFSVLWSHHWNEVVAWIIHVQFKPTRERSVHEHICHFFEYCCTGVHTLRNPTKKINFSVIWLAPLC
jgi:hypothetical protein